MGYKHVESINFPCNNHKNRKRVKRVTNLYRSAVRLDFWWSNIVPAGRANNHRTRIWMFGYTRSSGWSMITDWKVHSWGCDVKRWAIFYWHNSQWEGPFIRTIEYVCLFDLRCEIFIWFNIASHKGRELTCIILNWYLNGCSSIQVAIIWSESWQFIYANFSIILGNLSNLRGSKVNKVLK